MAREYGLPCIISAENATRVFKTGMIDGNLLEITILNRLGKPGGGRYKG